MSTYLLIPAYKPTQGLLPLLQEVLASRGSAVAGVYVVDDGSGPQFASIFDQCAALDGVEVRRHAVNLGKGAALKTGINAIFAEHPDARFVVTADADGQHAPDDILNVARAAHAEDTMVLGVREFGSDVPLRSRFGNLTTRQVMRLMTGTRLSDTQTGLRAIPRRMALDMLRIPLNGYDFEMECLVRLRSRSGGRLCEVPIKTIYIDDNRGSHFNPLLDSMRIYFVFLRYCAGSIMTFAVDYLLFIAVYASTGSIGLAIALARTVATFVSFFANRSLVFRSSAKITHAFVRFVALVVAFGFLSYLSTSWLVEALGWPAVAAKFAAEIVLFVAGFAANSLLVFRSEESTPSATDWDAYYRRPFPATSVTRRISERRLIRRMRQFRNADTVRMVELGGANSCFAQAILDGEPIERYDIVDLNEVGLERTRERFGTDARVHVHRADLLRERPELKGNVVMSVGLIEHFDPPQTKAVVDAHFASAEPGATVIITYPTPTLLYRSIRWLAELLRLWRFHDERPLRPEEVLEAVGDRGQLLSNETNWLIGLTQQIMVFRAK